jgi:hypothetical protein
VGDQASCGRIDKFSKKLQKFENLSENGRGGNGSKKHKYREKYVANRKQIWTLIWCGWGSYGGWGWVGYRLWKKYKVGTILLISDP